MRAATIDLLSLATTVVMFLLHGMVVLPVGSLVLEIGPLVPDRACLEGIFTFAQHRYAAEDRHGSHMYIKREFKTLVTIASEYLTYWIPVGLRYHYTLVNAFEARWSKLTSHRKSMGNCQLS